MSVNTNWSQRGKEALKAATPSRNGLKKLGQNNGGSLEPITTYYRYTAPNEPKANVGTLVAGMSVQGVYEGSFVDKYDKTQYKFRTDAGLVAVPGCAQLDNAMQGVIAGKKIIIDYNGKEPVKTGKNAGKESHSFDVYEA
jgi:hypothetical protein